MSRALIVYGGTYGQTERVAERIAGTLRDAGFAWTSTGEIGCRHRCR